MLTATPQRRLSPPRASSPPQKRKESSRAAAATMGHSNVWNSHPKNYGPGSRVWYVPLFFFTVAPPIRRVVVKLRDRMPGCW
ncbi:hypothetical protein ABZP36_008549 [Zizania latifolia]